MLFAEHDPWNGGMFVLAILSNSTQTKHQHKAYRQKYNVPTLACQLRISWPIGSFLLFLSIATATVNLASAAPLENSRAARYLVIRADYPEDYPYPHKDEITPKCTNEKEKSLFYTRVGKHGATGAKSEEFRKQKTFLLIIGDPYTYPAGYATPNSVKDGAKFDHDMTSKYYHCFIDELSEFFAEKNSGEVLVILPLSTDSANPGGNRCKSTWYRRELPAVTKVTKGGPTDITTKKHVWPRTDSQLFERAEEDGDCLEVTSPNMLLPPTGEDDDDKHMPSAQDTRECDNTITCSLDDTMHIEGGLEIRGNSDENDNCCTTLYGDCRVLGSFFRATVNLCGPSGHAKQRTHCADVAIAMNSRNIDSANNSKIGGKVSVPYPDGVTLQLAANLSA
ncbi:MAG: hypothetical protein Q9163_004106 [Psora crenata]